MSLDEHPIKVSPDLPLEERIRLLEARLAMLWDQVWWMNLSEETRRKYVAEGFMAPIENFYGHS